ncbi:DUF1996 domain-containing protein [Actinoplanes sp. CA-051413]|uniref:DUF1996 domain-containing protein n=1 Tax=Actinoplanes sp. CA-051413 TaxID=3239899 RepID=UPI003D97D143
MRRAALGVALTGALVAAGLAAAAGSASAATTVTVQAESYAGQSGAQVEPTVDTGGGQNVAYLANGDWLRYDNVDLGAAGAITLGARLASDSGTTGSIQFRTGSATGTVLASIPVTSTGGWQTWTTTSAVANTHPTGAQTVFLTLTSPQAGNFVNLNWFSVTAAGGTTPTTPATPTPTGTSGPGWPTVNAAQQAADTAAFFALTPRPITGNVVRVPEFNAGCTVSHHLNDDPIIFPGMAGASHAHTFLGNTSTNANSTNQSLLGHTVTTCTPAEDLSAYWIPSLLQNGTVIDPAGVTVYYGSRLKDPSRTQPFPPGFRMIAGDAKLQVPSSGNQFWCAGPGGQTGRSADGNWPICAPTANLTYQLVFPDCWDGVHLDSPNHKDHVGPTGPDGTCASGKFPVTIPSLSFVIDYPVHGTTAGFTLASGMASSMHGDFMNAWLPAAQAARVRNCIDQSVKCNAAGNN